MYTNYPQVLNFFRQAIHSPNLELKEIMCNFIAIKRYPDDIGAARYLMNQYTRYQDHIANLTANAYAK